MPFIRNPAMLLRAPFFTLADTFLWYCSNVPSLNFTSRAHGLTTVRMPPASLLAGSSGSYLYLEMFFGKRPAGRLKSLRTLARGVWTLPGYRRGRRINR